MKKHPFPLSSHLSHTVEVALLPRGHKDKRQGEIAKQTHVPKGHVALLLLLVALQELQGRDSKMQHRDLKSCQHHDGGV